MAPLSHRQKCCPESSELRQGVQEGALTNARVNSKPSSATCVKIRCGNVIVDSTRLELAIDACVLSPVVRKRHHDMRTISCPDDSDMVHGSHRSSRIPSRISPIVTESLRRERCSRTSSLSKLDSNSLWGNSYRNRSCPDNRLGNRELIQSGIHGDNGGNQNPLAMEVRIANPVRPLKAELNLLAIPIPFSIPTSSPRSPRS